MTIHRNARVPLGRLAMALVLAGMVGGIAVAPARADDGDRRDYRGERDYRRERERGDWRDHDRRAYRRERPEYIYAPPPVIYAPPPPSGIHLFFPLEIR
jgi:hypothetical protein